MCSLSFNLADLNWPREQSTSIRYMFFKSTHKHHLISLSTDFWVSTVRFSSWMFYLEKNEKDFSSKPELLMGNSFQILFSLKWRKVSCGGHALMTSCNQGGDVVYFDQSVGARHSECSSKHAFHCFWLKKLKKEQKARNFSKI